MPDDLGRDAVQVDAAVRRRDQVETRRVVRGHGRQKLDIQPLRRADNLRDIQQRLGVQMQPDRAALEIEIDQADPPLGLPRRPRAKSKAAWIASDVAPMPPERRTKLKTWHSCGGCPMPGRARARTRE